MNGSGTLLDPYQIVTIEDLQAVNNNLTAHYVLMNDIDASITSGWTYNYGSGFNPIGFMSQGGFTGSIDGQGFTISNLYSTNNISGTALIASGTGFILKNLKLSDVDFRGYYGAAALVGSSVNGHIENCAATGTISCTISNLVANQMNAVFGGLVAQSYGEPSQIINSYFRGIIDASSITNTSGEYYFNIGGILGADYNISSGGSIENSYTKVTANFDSGLNYITGAIISQSIYYNLPVNNCYYDSQAGNLTDTKATGLSTAQIQNELNLVGFDFETDWEINSLYNNNYPELKVFIYGLYENYSGGSEALVNAEPSFLIFIINQGGAESNLDISAAGNFSKLNYGGRTAAVDISAAGDFLKTIFNAAESNLYISTAGDFSKNGAGFSLNQIGVTQAADFRKVAFDGSASGAEITQEAFLLKIIPVDLEKLIEISGESGGVKAAAGSNAAEILVNAEGTGEILLRLGTVITLPVTSINKKAV